MILIVKNPNKALIILPINCHAASLMTNLCGETITNEIQNVKCRMQKIIKYRKLFFFVF